MQNESCCDRPQIVDDLERLQEDGCRIVDRLAHILTCVAPGEYEVLRGAGRSLNGAPAPSRVPDLSVSRVEDRNGPYRTRPPLLVVEVVSGGDPLAIYWTKANEYAEFGIDAYWIANPMTDGSVIDELRLEGGEYRHVGQAIGDGVFATEFPFRTRVVPNWLVDDGAWRKFIVGH